MTLKQISVSQLIWSKIMLKELFERNKNIVINTDIDGFLCGMILQKYYGCKVVGFSNSRETIWIKDGIDDINTFLNI